MSKKSLARRLWNSVSDPRRHAKQMIAQAIAEDLLKVVFQPLVDLRTGEIFAYECLARCGLEALRSPPVLFQTAVRARKVGELGRMLRHMAIDACPNFPLFLNVHPNEFSEGWLVQPNDPIFSHPESVYLEITESVPLHYFEQCHSVLAEVRSKDVFLAVDDLGAGYSNFKYISDLSPEIVKIDRGLIAGVEMGTRSFQLLRSLVSLCEDMGARVVAEGIETSTELKAAIEAGAHLGQGYLFARPGFPPPRASWPSNEVPNLAPNVPHRKPKSG